MIILMFINGNKWLLNKNNESFESNMKKFTLKVFKSKNDKSLNSFVDIKKINNQFNDNYIDVGYLCFENMKKIEFFYLNFLIFIKFF